MPRSCSSRLALAWPREAPFSPELRWGSHKRLGHPKGEPEASAPRGLGRNCLTSASAGCFLPSSPPPPACLQGKGEATALPCPSVSAVCSFSDWGLLPRLWSCRPLKMLCRDKPGILLGRPENNLGFFMKLLLRPITESQWAGARKETGRLWGARRPLGLAHPPYRWDEGSLGL